jgi:hypothetical protein
MAAISWPADLPATLRIAGLKGQYKDPVIRTEMDAGPAKARLRYTRPPKYYTGTMILNSEGLKTLDYFYRVTTRYGTLRFNFANPQTMEIREYRFRAPPDEGESEGLGCVTLQLEEL